MNSAKRPKSNDLCLARKATADTLAKKNEKAECTYLREKLQKAVIDNPQAARKAAMLIGLWIEGKEKKRKRTA